MREKFRVEILVEKNSEYKIKTFERRFLNQLRIHI